MVDLNIGIFSPMFSEVNGTAKATRSLTFALARQNATVHVFAPGIYNEDEFPSNIVIHRIHGLKVQENPRWYFPIIFFKYFTPGKHSYLDVTHSMSVDTVSILGMNYGKFIGIPKVATHHSPYAYYVEEYLGYMGRILKKFTWDIEKTLYNRYDLISVPTPSKKRLINEHKMVEPILVLSNGIESIYFKENVNTKIIDEKYPKQQGKKLLLYASRMSPEKNILKVIVYFKRILKKYKDSCLALVGKGPEVPKAKELVKRLGIEDNVIITGYVPFEELLSWYKRADISCLWSFVEAQGLVLLEAMAQGTPNIGPVADGIKDVIINNKTGYLVNSPNEFIEKVVYLFENEDIRRKFGENAKKEVQKHNIDNIAATWIKIYQKIKEWYPVRSDEEYQKKYQKMWQNFCRNNPYVSY
ncbi:MAG: glycosyltransferase [Promethearchaeota archaeon]